MTLDQVDTIVADLTLRMGQFVPRAEIEGLASELGRSRGEKTSRGTFWGSSLTEVENDLFIPDIDPIEPTIANSIIAQLLTQDCPAMKRHIANRKIREKRSDYNYENGEDDRINN